MADTEGKTITSNAQPTTRPLNVTQPAPRSTGDQAGTTDQTGTTDQAGAADQRQGTDGDRVMVKALKSFKGDEGMKSPGDEPFEVTRDRAAALRANGLVEYADEADEDAEIDAAAEAAADKAKADVTARRTRR